MEQKTQVMWKGKKKLSLLTFVHRERRGCDRRATTGAIKNGKHACTVEEGAARCTFVCAYSCKKKKCNMLRNLGICSLPKELFCKGD